MWILNFVKYVKLKWSLIKFKGLKVDIYFEYRE